MLIAKVRNWIFQTQQMDYTYKINLYRCYQSSLLFIDNLEFSIN